MIDTVQKRSSAVRMGIQSVYIPNGGVNTAQDRMNQAWWYGGTFVSVDDFFFWRADANDNQPYRLDDDSILNSQSDMDASTTWQENVRKSDTMETDENSTLTTQSAEDSLNTWVYPNAGSSPVSSDGDTDQFSQQSNGVTTGWGSPSIGSSAISSNEDSVLIWNAPDQIYDRN